ncbi:ABC transporter permease [Tannockella kyphosi]|uniref:ABC transporter permease n=1 Tax=Tannockella kyphosi TaxID=2899121 RepID=UPI002012E701|nr:ABC transporter permease [Tannockella kyphosi]
MNVITLFLFSIVVYNTVLLYGTLGEILTEKSGSLNLGVEGTMAIGAIIGYLAAVSTNSLWIGLIVAFIAAGLCGLLFAFLTVSLQANQNVTGLTITTFGLGLYFFIGKGFGSAWPALQSAPSVSAAYAAIEIPLLSEIPVLGKAFFSHSILVYLAVAIAVGLWLYLNYTKTGLRLRAVGENPSAADSVGINIILYKYIHIIVGSGIMGLGGLYMALVMGGSFEGSTCWINGYGWISIALVIFSNWNPLMAILGSLLFGFFNTLQVYSGSLANSFPEMFGWLSSIPAQLYQALPFIITAIVLIVTSIRQTQGGGGPEGLGANYFREDR